MAVNKHVSANGYKLQYIQELDMYMSQFQIPEYRFLASDRTVFVRYNGHGNYSTTERVVEQLGNATQRLKDHMMATWTEPFLSDFDNATSQNFKQYLDFIGMNWTYAYLDESLHMDQLETMAKQLGNVPTVKAANKVRQNQKARDARMDVVDFLFSVYALNGIWNLDENFRYSTIGAQYDGDDGPCFVTKQEFLADLPHSDTFSNQPFINGKCGTYEKTIINALVPISVLGEHMSLRLPLYGYFGNWYKENFCAHIMPENKLWSSSTTTEALKVGVLPFKEFYLMFDNCDTSADDYSVTRALGQSDRCYEGDRLIC